VTFSRSRREQCLSFLLRCSWASQISSSTKLRDSDASHLRIFHCSVVEISRREGSQGKVGRWLPRDQTYMRRTSHANEDGQTKSADSCVSRTQLPASS
jgi:hypothetical protein